MKSDLCIWVRRRAATFLHITNPALLRSRQSQGIHHLSAGFRNGALASLLFTKPGTPLCFERLQRLWRLMIWLNDRPMRRRLVYSYKEASRRAVASLSVEAGEKSWRPHCRPGSRRESKRGAFFSRLFIVHATHQARGGERGCSCCVASGLLAWGFPTQIALNGMRLCNSKSKGTPLWCVE
jgi:hypothetical protein